MSSLLYKLKMALCNLINPVEEVELNKWVENKKVISIGCGPVNYTYNEELTEINIGIDTSFDFIRYVCRKRNSSKSSFIVADACHLPFKDKAFDTLVASFLIHHVSDNHRGLLDEISRVTKDHVVIFDHVLADDKFKAFVQANYWRLFDRGARYHTQVEWHQLLKNYTVIRSVRTGKMFGNICKYVLKITT